jgi:hypothetical protein
VVLVRLLSALGASACDLCCGRNLSRHFGVQKGAEESAATSLCFTITNFKLDMKIGRGSSQKPCASHVT